MSIEEKMSSIIIGSLNIWKGKFMTEGSNMAGLLTSSLAGERK